MAPAVTRSFVACTVRDCGLPIERRDRVWVCPHGHSYDVARSGYVNLLQPQDRRSRLPGDSKAAVEARARLLARGIGRSLVDAVARRAAALDLGTDVPVVVDLGAGTGDALAAVGAVRAIEGLGIDLSTPAAEHAARRFPRLTWVVANADRRLPLLDRSVNLMLSLHARRNPLECARSLVAGGFLLAAAPAQDDLIELRAMVQGEALERDRADALVAEHAPFLEFVDRAHVREQRHLERESLRDLLRGTYRGERASASARVEALADMRVTLSSELLLFRKER
jgi:23S rRNA (guanine745-N1)-methyltransferase